MAYATYALLVALVAVSSAASVRNTRDADDEGCGQGCQSLGVDSDILSRCLRYACRKHVFRYYMRVGKRLGSISSDPAFRHRLVQRQQEKQRQWHRLDGRTKGRPQQWRQYVQKEPQRVEHVYQRGLGTRPHSNSPRRNSFHAMNLNNLYRNTNSKSGSKVWHRVVYVPMTSSRRRTNQRSRRRLPLHSTRTRVVT